MGPVRNLAVLALISLTAVATQASDLYVYPAKGQTAQQQTLDEGECYQFAKGRTGFDPMAAPRATSPRPAEEGSVVGGALGGALAGVAIGAIAGDAKKGAAIGATSGGLLGGIKKSSSRRDQEEWEQQQAQNYAYQRNEYNRAYTACLEGRGYSVR